MYYSLYFSRDSINSTHVSGYESTSWIVMIKHNDSLLVLSISSLLRPFSCNICIYTYICSSLLSSSLQFAFASLSFRMTCLSLQFVRTNADMDTGHGHM